MDHYQELRLLPDPEFPVPVLMNALFSKLHRALVDLPDPIGISFPDYDAKRLRLGDRLRMHGSASMLKALSERPWLQGLREHVDIGAITAAPTTDKSINVRRVQAKSNPERLLRRFMRRHKLSQDAAIARQQMTEGKRLSLPWLEIRSASTGQRFRLFVDQQVQDAPPTAGQFGSYGFSNSARLPWF